MFRRVLSAITPKRWLSPATPGGSGGWWSIIREAESGDWQRNVSLSIDTALSNHAVFACRNRIVSDISKLSLRLIRKDGKIWTETTNPAYSPVLRKPNDYQNVMQFLESWIGSKVQSGNTYVLKRRDMRGVVTKLYVLDPFRTRPMVADDGSVYYELNCDPLSELPDQVIVPASEIIHDRYNTLFHPLVGLSPLYAGMLAAAQGLNIQKQSAWFFKNQAKPSGYIMAPGHLSNEQAEQLKTLWNTNYGGENSGKTAVLADKMEFKTIASNAVDSQLVEQLKWSAEVVCSTFAVPPFMIGIGTQPTHGNLDALLSQYYAMCIQQYIKALERCLDEGLGLGDNIGVDVDIHELIRMDGAARMKMVTDGIKGGVYTPNEGRWFFDLPPIEGGDTVYLQEQDHALEALARRDQGPDPFGKGGGDEPSAAPEPEAEPESEPDDADDATEEAKSYGLFSTVLKEAA